VYDFGLTPEQFWRSTPAHLAELRKRYEREMERQEFSSALICYTVARIAGAKDVEIHDWMPSKQLFHTEPEPIDLKAQVYMAYRRFGGTFNNGS